MGTVIVIGGYFLLVAYLLYRSYRLQWSEKSVRPLVWTAVPAIALVVVALQLTFSKDSSQATTPEARVGEQLIGVWTHTAPMTGDKEPYGWERWVFTNDSVQIQSARPADLSWGPAASYAYEISHRKTVDTGTWYWHIHLKDTALSLAYLENVDGLTVMRIGAKNYYALAKKDKDLSK